MDTQRQAADDLLDVTRVLLLLQGSIQVATTIEALVWSFGFAGASGGILLSALAAVAILGARARLRADRRRPRRLLYVVEGLTLAFAAVDVALALVLTHSLPPVVALLTQVVLPIAVITLLRRSTRAASRSFPSQHVSALEVAS
jgi:hypothetical protein